MELDDLFTLLPSLFDFVSYLVTYPFTLLFNSAAGLFAAEFSFVGSVFQAILNVFINLFNMFSWLPVPVKIVFTFWVGLLVVLLICRIIGRVIQVFYPSGAGD